MTVAQLRARIVEVVQDSSHEGSILHHLNQALLYIAAKVDLPELDAAGTVTTATDAPFVPLPDDYMRKLTWVGSHRQGTRIGKLYDAYTTFLRHNTDPSLNESGEVRCAVVRGKNLYYQPVPATPDTLTLYYFAMPTLLVEEADEPSCIPVHLHDRLLVNYVCRELYSLIEDGVEGKKVNTEWHEIQFRQAMAELEAFVPKRGEPQYVPDEDDSIYGPTYF